MKTQTQREDSHVTTEAETGVMQLQAKGGGQPPEAGRGEKGFSPRTSRGNVALLTP